MRHGGFLRLRGTLPRLLAVGVAAVGVWAGSEWKAPLSQSWPAERSWNDKLEDEYSEFVFRIGQAVAQRRCHHLDACLRDPAANILFEAQTDPDLVLGVDCGDLPYVLRGYFSFKKHLPFGFVCGVEGIGEHVRYMSQVTPTKFCSWQSYKTPRDVLVSMSNAVHSGMYRMAPEVESADFYPTALDRRGVRPGTVYYDPNGHVLTVAEVRKDGSVLLMDGHPDGSLTWKRFGAAFALGGRGQGGGFKNFRTQALEGKEIRRARNEHLPLFDGQTQWDRSLWPQIGGQGSYHALVKQRLSLVTTPDIESDFRESLRALCRDVQERIDSVQEAVQAGLSHKAHPGELPQNIYGALGEWEQYATPSRDARLRAAVREMYDLTTSVAKDSPLLRSLGNVWQTESAKPDCRFSYVNSEGKSVAIGIGTVLSRIYALSFDPYHCPELRWGARPDSEEGRSCPIDAIKLQFYEKEQRLRQRIDREYGGKTPLQSGPEIAAPIDFRALLGVE
ncbi:MAG TPA: hypothetical protein PKO07_13245 [Pseudomonadota bacterium]|nr:hypothetical protein [Pseudomonadota bacterium]HNI59451.1 hypothetical protein [Pseudomonadota bacterium]HNN51985.1 hypothetical protein [Pseudomonadota bacterium]